jgi:uncharacterized SAM-binding protein YcdF (DUF218 family)
VPDGAILVEPNARNTGQNITFSRQVLDAAGITPQTVLLISKTLYGTALLRHSPQTLARG